MVVGHGARYARLVLAFFFIIITIIIGLMIVTVLRNWTHVQIAITIPCCPSVSPQRGLVAPSPPRTAFPNTERPQSLLHMCTTGAARVRKLDSEARSDRALPIAPIAPSNARAPWAVIMRWADPAGGSHTSPVRERSNDRIG